MLRSELLGRVSQPYLHLPRYMVELALDMMLGKITERLARGYRVELRGFGSFSSKVRVGRLGRNPRTGEPIEVAPKRHMHFRASRQLLKRLNCPTTPG